MVEGAVGAELLGGRLGVDGLAGRVEELVAPDVEDVLVERFEGR